MAKCDLCGADCKAHELAQLRESYQLPGVVDICPPCRSWADKLKGDLLLETSVKMREAIAARKGLPSRPTRWRSLKLAVSRFFST